MRILISGGSSGIGGLIVSQLAQNNELFCLSRSQPIEPSVRWIKLDLSDLDDVKRFAGEQLPQLGCNVFINNAAANDRVASIALQSDRNIEYSVNVNMLSPMIIIKHFIKHLVSSGETGSIINVSSMVTTLLPRGESLYGASKTGMEAFLKIIAKECGGHGITVNTLALGAAEMGLSSKLDSKVVESALSNSVINCRHSSAEILCAINLLLSDDFRILSGQRLDLAGF